MSQPRISILMPCKDAEATLAEALDSILNQTCGEFEFLIWDDGSTDSSPDVLAKYAAKDGRIRIVGHRSVGLVEALQRLSKEARGEFVARMDADDVSLAERLERQVAFLENHPKVALSGCRYVTIGDRGGSGKSRYDEWMNELVEPVDIRRELFIECPVAHPTFMVRRDIFEAVGGYQDHGWPEDYDLLMRLAVHEHAIAKVDEVLFEWRHHPQRTSLRDTRYDDSSFRALKRHYLTKLYPRRMETLYQWGAGEVGKRWMREWTSTAPHAVVDIHPRKVGARIHGFDVIAPEELPESGRAFIVVAVGAPGARENIRSWLDPRGYFEGSDYIFIA